MISISKGNSKMGSVTSVSLPPIVTCRKDCACANKCYARKIERLRKTVRDAYARNMKCLNETPEDYWREVEAAVMMSRFFRYHVSGDIPDSNYFNKMVEIANRNKHCKMICFTKKYDIINDYLYKGGKIPENLKMIMSAWVGLKMVNPFNLPEAHVRYRDGTTTAWRNTVECGGNCSECAVTDSGCWVISNGQQLILNEH